MKITIASGKGGTGKTILATNLAAYIAEEKKVVLVDLDVEEPNSGLFIKGECIREEFKFKMVPKWDENQCTLCGLCQTLCNFNAIVGVTNKIWIFPELCHSCYACSELCPGSALPMNQQKMGKLSHFRHGNLDLVESRLDIGQEQAVPLIFQTKEYVDTWFSQDIIKLFDSPPGTSCPVIEATKDAGLVILITEPTPFGLHDLKLAVDTLRALKKRFAVVLNRHGIGNDDVLNYCKAQEIPVWAKIPNDRRIAEFYSKGSLIFKEFPEVKLQLKNIKKMIFESDSGELE